MMEEKNIGGRPKEKEMIPYIQQWMDDNKYKNLLDAAKRSKIARSTLDRLADPEIPHDNFEAILELAAKMGKDPGEMMREILKDKKRSRPSVVLFPQEARKESK